MYGQKFTIFKGVTLHTKKKVFADRNTFLQFGYHFRYKALLL